MILMPAILSAQAMSPLSGFVKWLDLRVGLASFAARS